MMPTVHILMDDRVAEMRPQRLTAEHGFAAAIDEVLFDTGQSGAAVENARRLGLPTEYETIVLSHGHYDHTGGLPAFLDGAETVYTHPDALRSKVRDGGYIGLPYRRDRIEADAEIVTHGEPVEVSPGVHALGEIPREYPDNPTGEQVAEDGSRGPDPLLDDQSLAVETDDGMLLLCGCCHAGLRNTVEYAKTVTDDPVRAIVGGTHLNARDADEVHDLADWLDHHLDLNLLAPSHCTGSTAERVLAQRFPDAYEFLGVGSKIER
jgi:7,8-dihydropterin-6-yl-methyl-4-(beta-D-ribofuranosyl)aminobenzene 5'-phosphate synthase